MKEQLEKAVAAKRKYLDKKHELDIVYAHFWHNTDWKKELGKKNPTIKDKEQWVVLRESYSDMVYEVNRLEAVYIMEQGLYDIMMKNE